MITQMIVILILAAAIGSGLVGGIFLAFSSFIMAALGRIPAEQGIATMQAINITVLNPLFFLVFFGTGALSVALIGGAYLWWGQSSATLILLAGLIYLAGVIGVTMVFNVPLNRELAAVQATTPEAASLWSRYLEAWTWWNHVRTLGATVAAALWIVALRLPS